MPLLHYIMSNGIPILVIMNLLVSDLTIGSQNALWYNSILHFLWELTQDDLVIFRHVLIIIFLMVNGLLLGTARSCRVAHRSWLLNYDRDSQVRSEGTTQSSHTSPKTTSFCNFLRGIATETS